jgi:hypothetical protein
MLLLKTAQLQADIVTKERELDELVKGFEELLVEKAKAGQLPRVDRKPFQSGTNANPNAGSEQYIDDSRNQLTNPGYTAGQAPRNNRGSFHPGAYDGGSERADGFGMGYGDGGQKRRGGRGPNRGPWGPHPGAAGGYTGHDSHPANPYVDNHGPYQMQGYMYGAQHTGPMFVAHPGLGLAHKSVDYHPVNER